MVKKKTGKAIPTRSQIQSPTHVNQRILYHGTTPIAADLIPRRTLSSLVIGPTVPPRVEAPRKS
jgi:hypothetical protein